MQNLLFILVLLGLGFGFRRLGVFPKNTAQVLTTFVIYISLPALILLKIPELSISSDVLAPALMPWGMLVVSAALVLLVSRLLKWDRSTTGALMLVVPLGNTSFVGIPMVEAFFGAEHTVYAVIYDQLGTFLALATYGSVIVALYAEGTAFSWRSVGRKILTFPPFLALIVAFASKPLPYPEQLVSMLGAISATLVPLVIIAVGFEGDLRPRRDELRPIAVGLTIKLIIAPLIALGVYYAFDLRSPAARVAVFEAGMPPQIGAWALAMSANLAPRLAATMVGVGIIASFLTLSVLFWLL